MKGIYKALLCGDREWDDIELIKIWISVLKGRAAVDHLELVVISGGAPGADTMARLAAHELDVHCAEVHALWNTRHRGAGPQRNTIMRMLEPDICVAFHHDLTKSRGTKDMVKQCEKAGIEVQRVD